MILKGLDQANQEEVAHDLADEEVDGNLDSVDVVRFAQRVEICCNHRGGICGVHFWSFFHLWNGRRSLSPLCIAARIVLGNKYLPYAMVSRICSRSCFFGEIDCDTVKNLCW